MGFTWDCDFRGKTDMISLFYILWDDLGFLSPTWYRKHYFFNPYLLELYIYWTKDQQFKNIDECDEGKRMLQCCPILHIPE